MDPFPEKPGFYERVLKVSGTRYALSIPDGYDTSRSSPLALVLHWGGPAQPYRGSAVLSGLAVPALEPLGAIMVAPDCPENNWLTTRSEYVILELLDEIEQAYLIDPRRRLITGYSIGAQGTWFMGAKHQERFSAAIPISTTPPKGMVQMSWGIPLYVIHSRDDELFPLESTILIVEQLQRRGVQIELAVVDRLTHFNVAGFVQPLRDAVPWVEKQWLCV